MIFPLLKTLLGSKAFLIVNIIRKNISYIAGLYKLFDECIVNCRDHAVRMEQLIKNNPDNNNPLTYIDIGIDEEGIITFTNDGNGIDVAEHPEYKLWIPEMIFAFLACQNFQIKIMHVIQRTICDFLWIVRISLNTEEYVGCLNTERN